ncbi:signal transducer and activator of transcription 2 isoform X4 [Drosophila subobscura]|uniref:signal transducer and activator of transcription 2 isoform X4 n=1 Tax=Drosophila subobscura TaxID=7241 RepID=UPI00155A5B05|nr:signal transducer and activator of transcription 2 isoform X4 [Drosophila subobscura]
MSRSGICHIYTKYLSGASYKYQISSRQTKQFNCSTSTGSTWCVFIFWSYRWQLFKFLFISHQRVIFVALSVASSLLLLGLADATALSRTYLPPQVQVQQIVSRPQVQLVQQPLIHSVVQQQPLVHSVVQQRPVIQTVLVPQRTYLPPAPRVVSVYRPAPQVISVPRVQHQIISRPQVLVQQRPVLLPQRTYLPPAPRVVSIARPQVVSIARPQLISVAAPRRTYLPPQGAASTLDEQYEEPEEV